MRNTIAIAVDPAYGNDVLFDAASPLNRDNCLSLYHLLRERLEALGGWCHTLDVCRANGLDPDVVLYLDVPHGPVEPDAETWVILFECPVVAPRNWAPGAHDPFARVFTWFDPIVDGERYVKFNFTNRLFVPEPLDVDAAERSLATLIAGNKRADHPLELYSERVRAIRWFEQHHPEHFDLYGIGWDRDGEYFPSYRGTIDRKLDVQSRYWFTICFENARAIPGYITEKIFDCFLARSVPVYLGPGNITEHVPAEAFVDARDFRSYEELYDFLLSIEPEDYVRYLDAAREFIAGGRARQFSDEGCADVLIGQLRCERGATAVPGLGVRRARNWDA